MIQWHCHSTTNMTYETQHYRLFTPKIKSPWGTYHVSLSFCIIHLVHPCPWAKTVPGMDLPLLQKCVLWSWSIREHGASPILRKVGPILPCSWHLAHQLRQLNPEPFWQYQLCNHAFISRCPHWNCSQGSSARNTPKAPNPSPAHPEPFNHFWSNLNQSVTNHNTRMRAIMKWVTVMGDYGCRVVKSLVHFLGNILSISQLAFRAHPCCLCSSQEELPQWR